MSQFSLFGSQKSQIELITNGEIFETLRGKNPPVFPADEDYAEQVRSILLSRMNIEEDHLSSSQYLGFQTDTQQFVSNIRNQRRRISLKVYVIDLFCLFFAFVIGPFIKKYVILSNYYHDF